MRAVAYARYGGPEVLQQVEWPRPAAGRWRVLIRVRGLSLNPIDARIRRGQFRPLLPLRLPALTGLDVAGDIVEVGAGVTGLRPGDPVLGLLDPWESGASGDYIVTKASHVVLRPAGLGPAEGAALPLAGLTAFDGVRRVGRLVAGERVLIVGAAGGVGHFAVQIAKAEGAHVTAVCARVNADFVAALGADEVVAYDVQPLPPGARFDLIFDVAARGSFLTFRDHLTAGGRYVTTVPTPGTFISVGVARLTGRTSAFLLKPERIGLPYLLRLVAARTLRPWIDRTYGFDEMPAAHTHIETGHTRGKIVVAPAA